MNKLSQDFLQIMFDLLRGFRGQNLCWLGWFSDLYQQFSFA